MQSKNETIKVLLCVTSDKGAESTSRILLEFGCLNLQFRSASNIEAILQLDRLLLKPLVPEQKLYQY